jgi:ribonuclease T2
VDNGTINTMLDLMPARGLIINEWKKHGVCSGLTSRGYFETIRKARALIKVPPEYLEPKTALTVSPDEVEEAFVKANPELDRKGIAVTCSRTSLSEVRICLSRDLKFRECEQVDRQACQRDKLSMPPVRGG